MFLSVSLEQIRQIPMTNVRTKLILYWQHWLLSYNKYRLVLVGLRYIVVVY